MTTSTVFIANYDSEDDFVGWGSGFFVDEGIVVTNKHVLEKGDWHRVYATNQDDMVDFDCFRAIQKSDVRINLNDDVAYMRAYLPCQHGMLDFEDDPHPGDGISVLGYPTKGLSSTAVHLSVATGSVTSGQEIDWMRMDAYLDVGNSGGPVVNETGVVGVAVAKGEDEEGNYVTGFFIPSSMILDGLLYANDSRFGYVPRSRASSSRLSSVQSSAALSSSSVNSARGASASSRARSSASSRRSSRSSAPLVFSDVRTTRPSYAAILSLYERGVLQGYPDGTFRPNNGINRAEFIKILVAGFRDDEVRGETRCFRDVGDEWFASYVCAAKRLGWIDGYPDGTFRPTQRVNRAEAMKIVVTAFGGRSTLSTGRMPSDVRSGTWFYEYVAKGVAIGIVDPSVRFQPAQDLTRENGAMWIYGAER